MSSSAREKGMIYVCCTQTMASPPRTHEPLPSTLSQHRVFRAAPVMALVAKVDFSRHEVVPFWAMIGNAMVDGCMDHTETSRIMSHASRESPLRVTCRAIHFSRLSALQTAPQLHAVTQPFQRCGWAARGSGCDLPTSGPGTWTPTPRVVGVIITPGSQSPPK